MSDQTVIRIGSSVVLELDDTGYWVGSAALPSWAGLTREPDGAVYVEIDQEPSPTQRSACIWLLDNEATMLPAVLDAIAAAYPGLQNRYDYTEEEAAQLMPPLREARELMPLINFRCVYFHDVVNGTLPYIGFLFGCRWDQEHGLGVLMHGLRAVKVGGADTALLEWIADQDSAGAMSQG